MRLPVTLFGLLAAVPGTLADSIICHVDPGDDSLQVCLEFGEDDWMTNVTNACLDDVELDGNLTGEAETTNVTLSLSGTMLYRVVPQLIVANCLPASQTQRDPMIRFEIETAMGDEDTPSQVDSMSHALTLVVGIQRINGYVAGEKLTWHGDALRGDMEDIFTQLTISKAEGAERSMRTIGLAIPDAATAPGLPPVLEFSATAERFLALWEQSLSCPYNNLTETRPEDDYEGPYLELDEAPEPVYLEYGYFDPCLALRIAGRNCTEDPDACNTLNKDVVISLSTIVHEPVMYGGVYLENLDVHLEGTFIWQGSEVSTADSVAAEAELEAELTVEADELGDDGSGGGVQNGITWNGTMTADVRVFDEVVSFGSADFAEEDLTLDVEFIFGTDAVKVTGSVQWVSECMAANANVTTEQMEEYVPNSGSVNLTMSFVQTTLAGLATQQSCAEWLITGSVVGERVSLWGRYLKSSTVAMEVKSPTPSDPPTDPPATDSAGQPAARAGAVASVAITQPAMTGTIAGPVEMGSFINATGTIAFTGDGVQSFIVEGSLNIDGFVTGSLKLAITENDAASTTGTAIVSFHASNGVIPRLEASVAYFPESTTRLWTLEGELSSLTLFDIDLTRVKVALHGSPEDQTLNATDTWSTAVVWSGTVEGVIFVDGTRIAVTVPIADNQFQDMEGRLNLEGRNLAFEGTFHLDETSNNTGCGGLSFDAIGTLRLAEYTFNSTLVSHGCAGIGDALFTVIGNSATMSYGDLDLSNMAVHLEAFGKECDPDTCDATGFLLDTGASREIQRWAGHISGNSPLFGDTSMANLEFEGGEMGALNISTLFRSQTHVLAGNLWMIYEGCPGSSRGEAAMVLRLAGSQALNLTGSLEVNTCGTDASFGDAEFNGESNNPWRSAEGMTTGARSYLKATSSAFLETLSELSWIGNLTYDLAGSGSQTRQINTATADTSFNASVLYRDPLVNVTGVVSTIENVCVGTASIFVTNLAHGLPSLEVEGNLEVEGCTPGNAWVATATADSYIVPFFSRNLNLTNVRVTAKRADSSSPTTGTIRGTWRTDFFVTVEFSSDAPNTVKISGGVVQGQKSITSFLSAWNSGAPALPYSLGQGSPMLFEDIGAMRLAAVKFDLLYDTEEVVLTGAGSLYRSGFDATVVIRRQARQWLYGIHVASQVKNGPILTRVQDGPLANVLTRLSPKEITFSLGNRALGKSGIEANGVTFRGGLILGVHLLKDNAFIQTVLSRSPAAISSQIDAVEEVGGGFKLSADLSGEQVHVLTELAGDIGLGGSGATITALALDIFFSGIMPPQLGFSATIRATLSSDPHSVQFTSTGFIALPTSDGGALHINSWSVVRPDPWVNAFGVAGINVLFVSRLFNMKMTNALSPTEFSLVGSCETAGAVRDCTVSAPMPDFSKPVIMTGAGVDLKFLMAELSECPLCVLPVGKVLSNVTMERATVTANPGSSSPETVLVDGVSIEVPPGVVARADLVSMWQVIKMRRIEFSFAHEVKEFIAEPVRWGPVTIRSQVDPATGPNLTFALVLPKPEIRLNGYATIWGRFLPVGFSFDDKAKTGHFSAPVQGAPSSATFDANIVVTSVPGEPTFNNTVQGDVTVDLASLTTAATSWLLALQTAAERAVSRNSSLLLEAHVMQLLKTTILLQEQTAWGEQLTAWNGRIRALNKKLLAQQKTCARLKTTCTRSQQPKACAKYVVCLRQYKTLKLKRNSATAAKTASERTAEAQFRVVDEQSKEANETVTKLETSVSQAAATNVSFANMTAIAGGDLADAVAITSVTFTAPWSPTLSALNIRVEATVLGKPLIFNYQSDLTYATLRDVLISKVRAFLKSTWGTVIPTL